MISILTNERETLVKFGIESLAQKELSDAELESVYGGELGTGVGVGASASEASSTRVHSFAGMCDVNIFSNNVLRSGLLFNLLHIANCTTQICANND